MNSITQNQKNRDDVGSFLPKKLISKTVKEVDELVIFAINNEKVDEPKKQDIKDLLQNIKKFLLDKKASSSRKAEIILKMPLLQITVRKA